ncbi:hypothetical protein [Serratia marcescens]|nr:hypothetical protein [Serratia marcescens]
MAKVLIPPRQNEPGMLAKNSPQGRSIALTAVISAALTYLVLLVGGLLA